MSTVDLRGEDEEGKLGYAGALEEETATGISDADRRILDAIHRLHITPGQLDAIHRLHISPDQPSQPSHSSQYPRLSNFNGDKGDVSWETYKFEIEAVVRAGSFTENQILLGIRRSVRGEPGDIVRRLGIEATLDDVVTKLNSTYGFIDTREMVLKKFYSCTQQAGEKLTSFASRLEELFAQACDLKALRRTDSEVLKQVLYQGLQKDLKQMATYHCNTVDDYDRFKIELRKMEADLGSGEKKPCKPAVNTHADSELSEVKELLKKLNDRIDKIEKNKEEDSSKRPQNSQYKYSGKGRQFSYKSGDIDRSRGRGKYTRPTGRGTFMPNPNCFTCNEKGHLARDCPLKNIPRCFNCNKPGHFARNCNLNM